MLDETPESVRAALGYPFKDTPPPALAKLYKKLYIGFSVCVENEPEQREHLPGNSYRKTQKPECNGLDILFSNPSDQELDKIWHELASDPGQQDSYYWRTTLINLYSSVYQRPCLFIPHMPLKRLVNEEDPLLSTFLMAFGRVSIKVDHVILSNYLYHESILGRPVPLSEMLSLREAGLI